LRASPCRPQLAWEHRSQRVDLAGEGLDFAIRYGNGSWRNTEAIHLFTAPLSPVCAPPIAERITAPADLAEEALLRSYHADEWPRWFAAAGVTCPAIRGSVFDSSVTMAEAAAQGAGVALLPVAMFEPELSLGRLVQPFDVEVSIGSYWLTSLKSKAETRRDAGVSFVDRGGGCKYSGMSYAVAWSGIKAQVFTLRRGLSR